MLILVMSMETCKQICKVSNHSPCRVHIFKLFPGMTNVAPIQNGLDIGKLLQSLLGAFGQSKSFNGQNQYINKQTGQPATCEDLKSFLQDQINTQQMPYGNYQENSHFTAVKSRQTRNTFG